MSQLSFTVYGVAQPAGSKRGFPVVRPGGRMGIGIADANPKSAEWKKVVAGEVRREYRGPLLEGPLHVTFTFYQVRPKGHFGAKGLKPSSPRYPISRPDVLKLARGVEDALTSVIWNDDAQIVAERIYKAYCDPGQPARVEILIEQLSAGKK